MDVVCEEDALDIPTVGNDVIVLVDAELENFESVLQTLEGNHLAIFAPQEFLGATLSPDGSCDLDDVANGRGAYFNGTGGALVLCPETCEAVQSIPDAALSVYGCD